MMALAARQVILSGGVHRIANRKLERQARSGLSSQSGRMAVVMTPETAALAHVQCFGLPKSRPSKGTRSGRNGLLMLELFVPDLGYRWLTVPRMERLATHRRIASANKIEICASSIVISSKV